MSSRTDQQVIEVQATTGCSITVQPSIQDVVETYNISEEVLKPLRGEFIVNHYRVPMMVVNMKYMLPSTNGTKIYVNYGRIGYIIPTLLPL